MPKAVPIAESRKAEKDGDFDMDSRGALSLWMLLLVAAGCQHQASSVPSPGPHAPNVAPPQVIDPAQIKQASAKPKDLPPQVLVASADYKTGEALNPEASPQQQQQLWEVAHQEYEKALKINSKFIPAYQGLARLYKTMGERQQAVETYQKALRIEPKNATLWYELAMCHNAQKDWNAALNCLQSAAKFDPNNRNYQNAIGVVLAEAGRYDESLSYFTRTNGEGMGCYRLAQTLDRLQQPGLSRMYMEAALRKDPGLAEKLNPSVQQAGYQPAANPAPIVPESAPMPATPVIVSPPEQQSQVGRVLTPPLQQTAFQSAASAAPSASQSEPMSDAAPIIVTPSERQSQPRHVLPPPPPMIGE
jgi:tetratricopeptide (TPR) repeat protein